MRGPCSKKLLSMSLSEILNATDYLQVFKALLWSVQLRNWKSEAWSCGKHLEIISDWLSLKSLDLVRCIATVHETLGSGDWGFRVSDRRWLICKHIFKCFSQRVSESFRAGSFMASARVQLSIKTTLCCREHDLLLLWCQQPGQGMASERKQACAQVQRRQWKNLQDVCIFPWNNGDCQNALL